MLTNPRRLLITLLAFPLCLFVLPCDALAQHATSESPTFESAPPALESASSSPMAPQRLSRMAAELTERVAAQRSSRDSVTNGTLVGAAIGALALGAFGGLVCKAQQEPEGPSCWPDVFRIAAVGAAIGGGAGLAVDAAMNRNGGVRVSVGIRF